MRRNVAHSAEELLGGRLRANDPRRFLVEMMIGAMHADGHVDSRELETLDRLLGEHELFAGLTQSVRSALLESASDALIFAGGAHARLERTAAALPWRLHRLAAYAMACEIVTADAFVAESEDLYLRALRRHLVVDQAEAEPLLLGARQGAAMKVLESLRERSAELLAKAIRLAVAARLADRPLATGDAADIGARFADMLDFASAPPMAAATIEQMAIELPETQSDRCLELASRIRGPSDRYWSMAYALATRAETDWHAQPFLNLMRLGFEMSERAMDRCATHAAQIAAL